MYIGRRLRIFLPKADLCALRRGWFAIPERVVKGSARLFMTRYQYTEYTKPCINIYKPNGAVKFQPEYRFSRTCVLSSPHFLKASDELKFAFTGNFSTSVQSIDRAETEFSTDSFESHIPLKECLKFRLLIAS